MKAEELRIRNLVLFASMFLYVSEISRHGKIRLSSLIDEINTNIENCEEIPLSSHWLLRSGFEKINHRTEGVIYKKGWLTLSEGFSATWRGGYIGRIESVHRLQNIYFGLTQEELIIDLQWKESES